MPSMTLHHILMLHGLWQSSILMKYLYSVWMITFLVRKIGINGHFSGAGLYSFFQVRNWHPFKRFALLMILSGIRTMIKLACSRSTVNHKSSISILCRAKLAFIACPQWALPSRWPSTVKTLQMPRTTWMDSHRQLPHSRSNYSAKMV